MELQGRFQVQGFLIFPVLYDLNAVESYKIFISGKKYTYEHSYVESLCRFLELEMT